jgi:hypothetical protein
MLTVMRWCLPMLFWLLQGTYVYFDYNIMHDDLQTGWCYRRKENFTFRYMHLNRRITSWFGARRPARDAGSLRCHRLLSASL